MIDTLRIAFRDLRHDSLHFFCAVALIASLVGPLLVLLGAKIGAVSVLLGDMRNDPQNREVSIIGSHAFLPEDVQAVRDLPSVAFAQGQNSVTATGRVAFRTVNGDRLISGGYGVTGRGDPLTTQGGDLGADQVILSAAFARQLGASQGDLIRLELERGDPWSMVIEPRFTVLQILDRSVLSGKFALLGNQAITDIESFGLGYAVPSLGVATGKDPATRQDSFEKIRVYAATLEDLPDLVIEIERRFMVQTDARDTEVAAILRLERNLDALLGIVTFAGIAGLFLVLWAHFWSAVRRKALQWSLLSLMGNTPVSLAMVPVTQAIAVSVAGFALGLIVFLIASTVIDGWFAPMLADTQSVAVLPIATAVQVGAGVILIAALASGGAALAVLRTDPASIIRSS